MLDKSPPLNRACWKTQNNNISVRCTLRGFMGHYGCYKDCAALPLKKVQRTDNLCR